MTKLIVDISEHNSVTSLKNVDGVMIRFGYGFANEDKKVLKHIGIAESEGIPYGLYFYSYATNMEQCEQEKAFIKSFVKKYKPLLPICIDMEDVGGWKKKNGNPSKKMLTDITVELLECIESMGYYALLYCNEDWYNNRLDNSRLKPYDLWIAKWSTYKPNVAQPYNMWQYTSNGYVKGINGRIDMNRCYVDYPSIIKNAGLNGYKKGSTSNKKIKVGDKVKVKNPIDYDTGRKFVLYYDVYDVIEVNGKRAVIGIENIVTSAISTDNLIKL